MKTYDERYDICPSCGYVEGTPPQIAYHLHPGVTLRNGRYLIGTTVGFGGFGITYSAWDTVLEKKVAVKEYYPNGLVNRVPGQKEVIVYSGDRANEYQKGMDRFLSEARNAARFNTHPNIVNVYEFFQENNTAYLAMEFLEGTSLKDFIKGNGGILPPNMAVDIMLSVLDALKEIHSARIVHRDVSPDNIFMVPNENNGFNIKLIDFGAARFSSGEEEKELSIILKPGYAPPEQYRNKSKQGPWTDIYAVGAVLYRCITGVKPDESVNRVIEDTLRPPKELVPELPEQINDSIMRSLALNQELRFQSAEQFQEALRSRLKVRSLNNELKHRKKVRGIIISIACAVVLTGLLGCAGIYKFLQKAAYGIKADIAVVVPDYNEARAEEIQKAQAIASGFSSAAEGSGHLSMDMEDTTVMVSDMLREFNEKYANVSVSVKLAEAASGVGSAAVYDVGSGLSGVQDKDAYPMQTVYRQIDPSEYYFMKTKVFEQHYSDRKTCIPIAFSVPVFYVNTKAFYDDEIDALKGISDLSSLAAEYSMDETLYETYKDSLNADDSKIISGGLEAFLSRQCGCYFGTTDDYETVRAGLGGIYRMVVPVQMIRSHAVKGKFTHAWCIAAGSSETENRACENMVYYLISQRAEDIFCLRNGHGLPLSRKMMKEYAAGNEEYADILEIMEDLEMEYGENA